MPDLGDLPVISRDDVEIVASNKFITLDNGDVSREMGTSEQTEAGSSFPAVSFGGM